MKKLQLVITHYKILDTIYYLNLDYKYPLAEGVHKIIAGIIDEETINYQDLPTFGTLISFNSKKTCRYLLALQKYGYISKRFDKNTNNLYFELTPMGISALNKFHLEHKKPYVKKHRNINKTIVEIL